jgi:hypothetical protein
VAAYPGAPQPRHEHLLVNWSALFDDLAP